MRKSTPKKNQRPRPKPRPQRVTNAARPQQRANVAQRVAVGYIRVSTPRQAEEGDSLAAQQKAAKQFAAERGFALDSCYGDSGKSGRSTVGRNGLDRAVAHACREKGVLIVRSLSRLARSVIDLYDVVRRLEKSGADLASINERLDTSTAAGRAFFGILAVMAQFESDLIAERVREAYRFRRSIGRPILAGVPRFGTRVVRGKLAEDKRASQVFGLIRRLRKQGKSYKAIADTLNRRRIKTADQMYGRKRPGIRHAQWWPGTVHRLLARAANQQQERRL